MEMKIIARIKTDFKEKFGIPRQSGLVEGLLGKIVFEPEFRNPDALRGIEEFSHLWLVWQFSENLRDGWSAVVRPPRLGGNIKKGVFATRSSFRPNSIGLSSVKLEAVVQDEDCGLCLLVSGVDMLDNTPIFDIKPYLPYSDCHSDAKGGFGESVLDKKLEVFFPDSLIMLIKECDRQSIIQLLSQDPRTAYIHDSDRVWGISYKNYNIRFKVYGNILTVTDITFT